jgi:hypothetical protein
MAKTLFSSGVIVTSAWLNGARNIVFDGQDIDWHYNPLGLESLVTKGPSGLDSRYITLDTEQPVLSTTGIFLSGQPVSGNKVVTGAWKFGFDPNVNVTQPQNPANAPLSFLTNLKYDDANGINPATIAEKFAALLDADIITKKILVDQLDSFVADNGEY